MNKLERKNTSINKKYLVELDMKKQKYVEFLEKLDLRPITFNNYRNQVYKIRTLELILNKNKTIEQFTVDEIITLLKMMQVSSRGSAIAYRDRVLDYFKFCISEFKINFDMTSLEILKENSIIESMINKTKNRSKFVTESVIYEESDNLVNPQDRVIIRLIFEGIKGVKNIDLVNLKKSNYNRLDRTLEYIEHATGEVKKLDVNEFLADDIEKTILADTYYFKNGEARGKNTEGDLTKTEYLLEPNPQFYLNLKQPVPEGDKLLGRTVQRRGLDCLKKYLMINGGLVSVESLYSSGLINRAVKESIFRKFTKQEFVNFIQNESTMGRQSGYRMYPVYDEMYEEFKKNIVIE